MDVARLATGLACNRILFGVGFLIAPDRSAKSWIGPPAETAGGGLMVRAAGARDLALGAGALRALRGAEDARPWFAAHALADGADFAATWLARREIGPARTAYALFMAGASTAVALAYVVGGQRDDAAMADNLGVDASATDPPASGSTRPSRGGAVEALGGASPTHRNG
jgi:hypothetical protein